MANILDLITIGEKKYIVVDADPAAGGGTVGSLGDLAIWDNGSTAKLYIKTAAANTGWDQVSTTASSGTVAAGVAGRLGLYPSSSNGIDDVYVQNSQNITVSIAAQGSRSAALDYVLPNPGDAVTSASVVLTEGAQTINGALTLGSALNMGSNKISSLLDPSFAQDAATKFYVDSVANGLSWKTSVRLATTANHGLTGLAAIDGVTPIGGNRVLVKANTAPEQNGIYVVAAGAWSRALDMDTGTETVGAAIFVEEGTSFADTAWVQVTDAPVTIGVTALTFTQFAGAGSYTAGNGLSLTGTQFAISLAANSGLQFSSSQLDLFLDGTTLSKSATGLKVATGGITNTEVNASAAIAYSKLNLATSIVNGDISASAAIARTKLASGSANHVIINDGSGVLSSEAQLSLTRGGTAASLTAVAGGIVYSGASALAIGTAGTAGQPLLSGGSGAPTWFASTGVVKATSGVLSVSNVSLTAEVTGVLPIANGGTNSSTTLNNNRLMISSGSAIVEHAALTLGQVMVPNSSGLPIGSSAFFWDASNSRLGINTSGTPTESLHVIGNILVGTAGIAKHQAVSGILWQEQQATVATTNATVTTLDSFTVPSDTAVLIEFRVVGRRTGGVSGSAGDASTYVRTARIANIGGTLSIFNSQSDYTSEAVNATNCVIDVSGTAVRCRVTGVATTNMSWFSHAKILNA